MPGLVMIGPVVWAVGELYTQTHTHERYYFIYIDTHNVWFTLETSSYVLMMLNLVFILSLNTRPGDLESLIST